MTEALTDTELEDLKRKIVDARERGDTTELRRLQAIYRTRAVVNASERSAILPPVRLEEGRR